MRHLEKGGYLDEAKRKACEIMRLTGIESLCSIRHGFRHGGVESKLATCGWTGSAQCPASPYTSCATAHQRRPGADSPITANPRSTTCTADTSRGAPRIVAGSTKAMLTSVSATDCGAAKLSFIRNVHSGCIVGHISVVRAHVVDGLRAGSPASSSRRSEAARAHGVEDVKHERVLLRCEVQDPNDVDDGEDEVTSGHGIQRSVLCVYPDIPAHNGENNGNGSKYRYLEAMHGDGIARESVEDAEDQEQLEEYRKPLHSDLGVNSCVKISRGSCRIDAEKRLTFGFCYHLGYESNEPGDLCGVVTRMTHQQAEKETHHCEDRGTEKEIVS